MTVTGGVTTGLLVGMELLEDVIMGPVSVEAIDADTLIQGNRFAQGFSSDGGVSMRDNEITGSVTLGGTRSRELIGNMFRGAGVAFNTAAPTLIERNTIEDADIGLRRFSTAHDSHAVWIVGNTIRARTTGMTLPFGTNEGLRALHVLFNQVSGFSTDGISVSYFAAGSIPPRIEGNVVEGAPASGAGISVSYGWLDPTGTTGPRVERNTVLHAATGVRIQCSQCANSDATLASNIIAFSEAGVDVAPQPMLAATNNDFFSNASDGIPLGPTDLSADPLFVDAAAGDFHLTPESPCLDHGTASAFITDEAGLPRSQDGDLDGAAIPDVGALESTPEVTGLRVEANPLLVRWDAYPFASAGYDVYRSRWSLLHSVGIVQGPAICAWGTTTFPADDTVQEGDGTIYLVAPHGAVPGSLGFDGDGIERLNPAPCP
jgi:hypothetical protein